jgi:hypothetical protein
MNMNNRKYEFVTSIYAYLAHVSKTAGRTVGELCRKFGERILGEIMPLLKAKAISPDSRTREGVSLTICHVM